MYEHNHIYSHIKLLLGVEDLDLSTQIKDLNIDEVDFYKEIEQYYDILLFYDFKTIGDLVMEIIFSLYLKMNLDEGCK